MGKNISYTCDFCGSTLDLDKQVGILEYYTRYRTLNKQKYICDKCLEKISLILSNESNR